MAHSTKIVFILVWVVIIATAGIFWYHGRLARSLQGNEIKTISIGRTPFQVEVVSSRQKMEQGLGGRKNMCKTCAMLFVFPKPGIQSFWMKGMEFPLDMVWILDGAIVHIEKNVQPDFTGTLAPSQNADSVLELNAGTVDAYSLKVGDSLR